MSPPGRLFPSPQWSPIRRRPSPVGPLEVRVGFGEPVEVVGPRLRTLVIRLALDPDAVDAVRFQALAAAGREELRRDPRQAGQTLREALALWRGPALADAATARFAAAAVARLEELHLGAVEDRIDADLAAGGHAAVLAELDELVRRSRPGVTALFRAREGGRSPGASRFGA